MPAGAAGHLYANLGLSGMRVDRYGEDHLRKYIPQNVDLIVLENIDATAEGFGLETLLMAIERHFNGTMPAILVWNSGILFSDGQGCWGGEPYCQPDHCGEPKFLVTDGNYVLSRREDVVFRLAQWYGISALSWRGLTLGMERDGGLLNLTECQFAAALHMDASHPSLLGDVRRRIISSCAVLIADAIMNLLVHAQNHLINHPGHGPPGRPPTRLYVDPRVRHPKDQVQPHTLTFFSATDQDAATQLRVQNTSSGWNFTLHQLHGNATKYKPGWVGLKVGARLVVRMPPELQLWRTHLRMATLRVAYLSSYKFMGAVLVRCVSPSACACDPTIISGSIDGAGDWKGKHQVSITDEKGIRLYQPRHWAWDGPANAKSLVVTGERGASPPLAGLAQQVTGPLPGEAECDVEFTVMESRLAGSGSDVHKFKITRLTLDYDVSIWQ
ncbi:hypothetical protein HXX76_009476 [Chlamydomonas incerta]|uniref:Uncharacterized protein n=1 Tax=Chlamydomonas incerta TaxID=51695 RepID=A0A835STA1_CHLIN|nr:hypothetical protein HXX76_009476 [Chlamydomonas incerta]|eukprot:KAG2431461.1 hypothetical protein HXX76_009476 [Chlamydomonas incerta]